MVKSGCSPNYDHDIYFPTLVSRYRKVKKIENMSSDFLISTESKSYTKRNSAISFEVFGLTILAMLLMLDMWLAGNESITRKALYGFLSRCSSYGVHEAWYTLLYTILYS